MIFIESSPKKQRKLIQYCKENGIYKHVVKNTREFNDEGEAEKFEITFDSVESSKTFDTSKVRFGKGLTLEKPKGVSFAESDDGTHYIVSKISTCTDTEIIIPYTYNNLPVTEIESGAFAGCTSLESIKIPSGVTSIGDSAFEDCTGLTIYCEAESQPSGWADNWNVSSRPVVWGHTHAYENGSCVCGKTEN